MLDRSLDVLVYYNCVEIWRYKQGGAAVLLAACIYKGRLEPPLVCLTAQWTVAAVCFIYLDWSKNC